MKKIITAAMLTMLALPSIASATDIKLYAGGGLGIFGLDYADSTFSVNKTAFGGYGNFGADFNDYFGAEVRIGATGSVSKASPTTTVTLKVPSFFSYLAKVQFPATPDFKLYGLVGATTANFQGTNTAGFNRTETKTGLSYGAGADYTVQDKLSIGAEWVQYWNKVNLPSTWGANAEAKIWGAVITAKYHF